MIINFINPPSSGGSGGSDPTKLPLAGGIMNTNASVSFTADVYPETPFLNFNVHTENEYANFYGSISAGGLNFNDNNNDQRAVTLGYFDGLNCSNIDGLSSNLSVSGLSVTQLAYNSENDVYYQKILTANTDGVGTEWNDGGSDYWWYVNNSGLYFGSTDNGISFNGNGIQFQSNGNLPDFRVKPEGVGVYGNGGTELNNWSVSDQGFYLNDTGLNSSNVYGYQWSFGQNGLVFSDGSTQPTAGLPLTGGTMTGTISSTSTIPATFLSYDSFSDDGEGGLYQIGKVRIGNDGSHCFVKLYNDNQGNSIGLFDGGDGVGDAYIQFSDNTIQKTAYAPTVGNSGLSQSGNMAHSDYPKEIQLTINGVVYAIPARLV